MEVQSIVSALLYSSLDVAPAIGSTYSRCLQDKASLSKQIIWKILSAYHEASYLIGLALNFGIAAITSSSIRALPLYRGGLARKLVANLGICNMQEKFE